MSMSARTRQRQKRERQKREEYGRRGGNRQHSQQLNWIIALAAIFLSAALAFASPAALSAQGACGDTITVAPGDTLREIAAACNTTVDAIVGANPEIVNPNRIYVGQVLTIPDGNSDITPESAISFVPAAGPPGTVVDVTISNFPPSSQATVMFSTGQQAIVTESVQVDANGSATAQMTVPNVDPVDAGYIIGAFVTGTPQGVVEAAAPFIVQADNGSGQPGAGEPQVSVNPTSGPPNTVLNITAFNFPPSTQVNVGLGEPESEAFVQVDRTTTAAGTLNTQLEIPGDAQPDQRFVALVYVPGPDGARATSQEFVTTSQAQQPDVSIEPAEGPPGASVRLQSSGYAPNLPVEIGFGRVDSEYDIIAQASTDENGVIDRRVSVPNFAQAGVEYVFVVLPSDTRSEVISNIFTVTDNGEQIDPQVNISPRSGPPSANIHATVSGFPPNTRISYGMGEPASELFQVFSARTNGTGSVQLTLQVPESATEGQELVVTAYVPRQGGARATSTPFSVVQSQDENGGNLFTSTNIYLVALEDAGQSGQEIGCSDSIIPVEVQIEPTIAPLTAALETLLAIDERFYGQSGLYNALYQSDLAVERIDIVNGVASIYLTGEYSIGGVCDEPRFRAQLEETALQYYTVNEVRIFINGEPLSF